MITVKCDRNIGLTTSLIDRVMLDDKLILVVDTFAQQAVANSKMYDMLTDGGTKEVPREQVEEIRSRIVVLYEYFCMPPVQVKEGYTYLVDECKDPDKGMRFLALLHESKVSYEMYYGHYPNDGIRRLL